MTLVVGLGNPDLKYKNNRHNVGFMLIDKLIDELNTTDISKPQFRGILHKSRDILLLKPHTYMNLSGQSVRAVCDYYKPEKVIVAHDDLDLPFGSLRYKLGGGHGGHNGLKSIDANIGKDYFRVRIGISKPQDKSKIASYVLSDFSKDELLKLDSILDVALKAVKELINEELSTICQRYTLKKA